MPNIAAFTSVTISETGVNSLVVGGAPGATSGTGGIKAGQATFTAGLAIGGGTISTAGIVMPTGVPSTTTMALYNNSGTLTWNGIALATGASLSGTSGTVARFTSSNAVGDSILVESGGNLITLTGTMNATTAYQLNGTSINTGGTLTNVAYEDQANNFTNANGQTFGGGIGLSGGSPSTHGINIPSAVPGTLTTNLHNNGSVLVWTGGATFPGTVTVTALTYTTSVKSTTALATPGALSATQATAFASTVSGASLMGYGTTNDVSLMNRAGTVVLGVGPNTTTVNMTGLLNVTGFGAHSFSASGTGTQSIELRNSTAGASNNVLFSLGTDTSGAGELRALSSTYTTSGPLVQNSVALVSSVSGGLSIAATNASGAIRFYSGGSTEWMRLTTAGILAIGTTTSYSEGGRAGLISGGFSFATSWGLYLNETASTSGAGFIIFGLGAGTGTSGIGSITRNGSTSAVLYNLTSDSRLKHDRGLATDLSGLRALQVHDFTWINDPTQALDRNVFAQEAYTAIGRGITPGDDDLVTITKPWMVDRTSFIPDLIVGWQQHDARLAAMEAKLLAAGV